MLSLLVPEPFALRDPNSRFSTTQLAPAGSRFGQVSCMYYCVLLQSLSPLKARHEELWHCWENMNLPCAPSSFPLQSQMSLFLLQATCAPFLSSSRQHVPLQCLAALKSTSLIALPWLTSGTGSLLLLTEMLITSPHPQSCRLWAGFTLPGNPKRWQWPWQRGSENGGPLAPLRGTGSSTGDNEKWQTGWARENWQIVINNKIMIKRCQLATASSVIGLDLREGTCCRLSWKTSRPVGIVYSEDASPPPPSPTLVLANTSLTLRLQTSHDIWHSSGHHFGQSTDGTS